MKKWFVIVPCFVFFILITFVFRPLPTATNSNTVTISGEVERVFEGGVKDVVFQLKNNDHIYYINRGLENGLDLLDLQQRLKNEFITLKFIEHWTPLDPDNTGHHIAYLEHNGKVIFNEIKQ